MTRRKKRSKSLCSLFCLSCSNSDTVSVSIPACLHVFSGSVYLGFCLCLCFSACLRHACLSRYRKPACSFLPLSVLCYFDCLSARVRLTPCDWLVLRFLPVMRLLVELALFVLAVLFVSYFVCSPHTTQHTFRLGFSGD